MASARPSQSRDGRWKQSCTTWGKRYCELQAREVAPFYPCFNVEGWELVQDPFHSNPRGSPPPTLKPILNWEGEGGQHHASKWCSRIVSTYCLVLSRTSVAQTVWRKRARRRAPTATAPRSNSGRCRVSQSSASTTPRAGSPGWLQLRSPKCRRRVLAAAAGLAALARCRNAIECTGGALDSRWTYIGRTLDVHWTHIGRTLDSVKNGTCAILKIHYL